MPKALLLMSFAVAIGAALPLLVFTLEVYLGLWPVRRLTFASSPPSTCVLIPAHNEAQVLGLTLERLKPSIWEESRVLVIADNCSDETTRIASAAGVEVIERVEPERRGKDFALAFGREHLRAAPPECVIVFDADCFANEGALNELAQCAIDRKAAVQAQYTFQPAPSAAPMVQISNFAIWIKNVVRQRGAQRAGAGAVLTGTGMAFPWEVFKDLPLATGNIVEDLAIGAALTRQGRPPFFLEQAVVSSVAAHQDATLAQRSRWEHGFLSTARSQGAPLGWTGLKSGNWKTLWLGLHLLVPPFALLLAVSTLVLVILALTSLVTASIWPFIIVLVHLTLAVIGVLLNWMIEGRKWLRPSVLVLLPFYVLWKIPVYARYLIGRRSGWVRTKR